jgi:hypothetical protein
VQGCSIAQTINEGRNEIMKRLLAGILFLSLAVPGYPAEWKPLETNPGGMMLYMKPGECEGSVCRADILIKGKDDDPADGLYAYPQFDCDKELYRDSRPSESFSKGVQKSYPASDWGAARDQSAVQKVMKAVCPQKP